MASVPRNNEIDNQAEFRFEDYSDALVSIVDEPEETWLFKILNHPSLLILNHLLPLVDWMEDHKMLELRPNDRKELLLKVQRRSAKIVPYSSATQIIQSLERIKTRHDRRIAAAVESGDLSNLQALLNSFLIINKLAVWMVGRELQNVEYLRVVRANMETFFVGEKPLLGKSLSSGEGPVLRSLAQMDLVTHVLILAYVTDYYQELAPQFRHVFGKRNHVKEVFDDTFAQTISLLMEKLPGADIMGELNAVSTQYGELVPGMVLKARDILKSINLMIANVNTRAHGTHPHPLLPVASE